ncbi:MAG: hypothetical protein NT091_04245 [Candidatus Falkowbacteria bacterium]|nr:hypothetical protein [Candidatus Falkowbacteria bacterium]
MSKLQEVFNRIKEAKKEQKKINKLYRDALDNHREYKEVVENSKKYRERKKQIEETVKEDFSSELSRLDTIKLDIQNDSMLLSDIAITKLVKGEKVEVKDENDEAYEPLFTVRFKKSS